MNIWCLVFLTKYVFIILKLSGIFQDLPTHEKKHPAECFSSTKWLFEKGRRADNHLSARVLWKKSYKQHLYQMSLCLWLYDIHKTWRNRVNCVKEFWRLFEQDMNTKKGNCSHPNSIIFIIPPRTERTLFRLLPTWSFLSLLRKCCFYAMIGTGKHPWQEWLLLFSLPGLPGVHRKGGGADDSIRNFIRCDWDNRITYLIWRFAHRITFLSR